jgi:Zn-dependent M28 family amino/carboxypeptidase
MPLPATTLVVHGEQVPPRQTWLILAMDAYATIGTLENGTIVKFDADVKSASAGTTYNAVGRLTGSNPAQLGEVILLTAHLDHLGARGNLDDKIFNGADDDASGTTAVLELAEALAKGTRPRRTIIFALFGSEEAGGYGASAFVGLPPVPLNNIVANLEFEMIGRSDRLVPADTLWLTGYERTNLGPELAMHGAKMVADPHPEQNFFMRSDNIQLARAGVVAQTVSSFGLHSDYHRPSDDVSTIDFPHMTQSIQSMLSPILWLANSSFKPEWFPGKKP